MNLIWVTIKGLATMKGIPATRCRSTAFISTVSASPQRRQPTCNTPAFLDAALAQRQVQIKDGLVYSADGKFLYCDTHDSDKASNTMS